MVNVTASYSPKHFLLESLSNYSTFPWWQKDSFDRSWNLPINLSTNSMSCSTCEIPCISYNNQVLLGWISGCIPPSCTFQKEGPPLPFILANKRVYLDTHLKEELSLLICFENCQGVACSHRHSRKMKMNT